MENRESMPYFFTNKKWFSLDPERGGYVLTKDAPKEAVDSFLSYYTPIFGPTEAKRRARLALANAM